MDFLGGGGGLGLQGPVGLGFRVLGFGQIICKDWVLSFGFGSLELRAQGYWVKGLGLGLGVQAFGVGVQSLWLRVLA